MKNLNKKKFCILFFIFLPVFSLAFKETLSNEYLDQVIHRKKSKIHQCFKKNGASISDMMVELTVFSSGKTKSRLLRTARPDIKTSSCILSLLDKIKFKKFHGTLIKKIYYFKFK